MKNKFLNIPSSGFCLKSKTQIPELLLLFLFLSLSSFSFAQVQIEEEVVLNKDTKLNNISLKLPFYGDVTLKIQKPIQGNCQWPRGYVCFSYVVGSNQVNHGCCDCLPSTNCTTSGDFDLTYINQTINTPVELSVKRCSNGVWQDGSIYSVEISKTYYELWGNIAGNPPCKFGWIEFTPNLLDCPQANGNYCDQFQTEYPKFELEPTQFSNYYFSTSPCITNPDWIAFSQGAGKNLTYFELSSFCFNRYTRKWQFKVDNLNTLRYKWIIDFCTQNLSTLYPNSILVNNLSDVPSNYPCNDLIADIKKHADHIGYVTSPPKYFIKSILYLHEIGHYYKYREYLLSYEKTFYEFFDKEVKQECPDFNGSLQDIEKVRTAIYTAFSEPIIKAKDDYDKETGPNGNEAYWEKYYDDVYVRPVIDVLVFLISNSCI